MRYRIVSNGYKQFVMVKKKFVCKKCRAIFYKDLKFSYKNKKIGKRLIGGNLPSVCPKCKKIYARIHNKEWRNHRFAEK